MLNLVITYLYRVTLQAKWQMFVNIMDIPFWRTAFFSTPAKGVVENRIRCKFLSPFSSFISRSQLLTLCNLLFLPYTLKIRLGSKDDLCNDVIFCQFHHLFSLLGHRIYFEPAD